VLTVADLFSAAVFVRAIPHELTNPHCWPTLLPADNLSYYFYIFSANRVRLYIMRADTCLIMLANIVGHQCCWPTVLSANSVIFCLWCGHKWHRIK